MKLKQISSSILLSFLFIFSANMSLEARHHCYSHSHVHVVSHQYITPVYYEAPCAVHHCYPQPVFIQQPVVVQERVYVQKRNCQAANVASFLFGVGFGLLAR